MRLGDAVFAGRITGFAFLRHDLTLAGQAALELGSDFFAGPSFKRIGATAEHQGAADRD